MIVLYLIIFIRVLKHYYDSLSWRILDISINSFILLLSMTSEINALELEVNKGLSTFPQLVLDCILEEIRYF